MILTETASTLGSALASGHACMPFTAWWLKPPVGDIRAGMASTLTTPAANFFLSLGTFIETFELPPNSRLQTGFGKVLSQLCQYDCWTRRT